MHGPDATVPLCAVPSGPLSVVRSFLDADARHALRRVCRQLGALPVAPGAALVVAAGSEPALRAARRRLDGPMTAEAAWQATARRVVLRLVRQGGHERRLVRLVVVRGLVALLGHACPGVDDVVVEFPARGLVVPMATAALATLALAARAWPAAARLSLLSRPGVLEAKDKQWFGDPAIEPTCGVAPLRFFPADVRRRLTVCDLQLLLVGTEQEDGRGPFPLLGDVRLATPLPPVLPLGLFPAAHTVWFGRATTRDIEPLLRAGLGPTVRVVDCSTSDAERFVNPATFLPPLPWPGGVRVFRCTQASRVRLAHAGSATRFEVGGDGVPFNPALDAGLLWRCEALAVSVWSFSDQMQETCDRTEAAVAAGTRLDAVRRVSVERVLFFGEDANARVPGFWRAARAVLRLAPGARFVSLPPHGIGHDPETIAALPPGTTALRLFTGRACIPNTEPDPNALQVAGLARVFGALPCLRSVEVHDEAPVAAVVVEALAQARGRRAAPVNVSVSHPGGAWRWPGPDPDPTAVVREVVVVGDEGIPDDDDGGGGRWRAAVRTVHLTGDPRRPGWGAAAARAFPRASAVLVGRRFLCPVDEENRTVGGWLLALRELRTLCAGIGPSLRVLGMHTPESGLATRMLGRLVFAAPDVTAACPWLECPVRTPASAGGGPNSWQVPSEPPAASPALERWWVVVALGVPRLACLAASTAVP